MRMLADVTPLKLMVLGFMLLLASWFVLFFMVVRLIPPSFLLSLGAYAASLGGLVIGIFGAIQHARQERRVGKG